MKTIKFFLIVLVAFAVSCTTDYIEPNYDYRTVKVPNLIQIETQNEYHLNDTLFVNVIFSRYLPEIGYADSLDIYKTTLSDKFNSRYGFYKKTAYGHWANYDVSGNLIITKGVYNYYALAATYNFINQKYELRFGIPLKETGTFKLALNRELISDNNCCSKGIPITISTSVINPGLNVTYNESEYYFEVN